MLDDDEENVMTMMREMRMKVNQKKKMMLKR